MNMNKITQDIISCFNDFIKEFSFLEKKISNGASNYNDEYKSLKLKFKIIDTYLENIVTKRNFEIIDFSTHYTKIHELKHFIQIIDNRIILFNTKSIGLFELLPSEMLFKIFSYMNEKDLFKFSKCGINFLKIINDYREYIFLKNNKDKDDVFYQKYLYSKNDTLYNQLHFNNLTYNRKICYTLDPCEYSHSLFS